jgi:ribosomal protein S18 acetylase RimI-like enzyme
MEAGARAATADEAGHLAELARAAVAELTPTKGGALWARREARAEPVEDGLTAELADPDHLVLVGTIDGAVVGYAAARLETLRDGGRLAVLTDVYVEAGAREVSVGSALMDEVLRWCESRGALGVDSLALPGNRATKNFFESYGLVARAIVVHRPLGGGSAGDGNGG